MTKFGGFARTSGTIRSNKLRNRLLIGAAFASALIAGPMAHAAGPVLSRTPTSISFGNKQIGTTSLVQAVFVQNTGDAPLIVGVINLTGADPSQFGITGDGCSGQTLPTAFSNCTFDVTFAPTSIGAKNATVNIPSNATNGTQTIGLSGTGVNPQVTVSPTSISFGNKQTGTTSMSMSVFVQNSGTGSGPITIGSLTIGGSGANQFAVINDGCSNATLTTQFDNCTFDVTFSPTSTGAKSATITIPSNDPVARTVSLTGTGVNPEVTVSPTSISFGNLGVGTTGTPQTVFVQNTGSGGGSVTIGTIQSNSSQFVIGNDGCSGVTLNTTFDSCSFDVAFAPTSPGAKNAVISVSSNDPLTRTVSLTGTGVSPFTVSPSAIAFGNVELGQTSPPRTISITSNTNSPTMFGGGTVTGPDAADFLVEEDGCSNVTLFFSGQSCEVLVKYRPGVIAAESATFQVTSDQGTISVPMTGSGVDTLGPSTAWTTTNNSIRVSLLQSVNGTAADLSGVQSVSVTFTDMLGSSMTMPATLNCNAGNKSCEFSVTVPLMLPGLVEARISAADVRGNISTGPAVMLIVI